MRTIAVADELARRTFQATFLTRELPDDLREVIVARGHRVISSSSSDDPDAWSARLDGRATWMLVDHYQLGASWERGARRLAPSVAIIDDLGNRTHDATILIDHNLDATREKYDGLVGRETTLLVGPRYALLRREFGAARALIGPVAGKVSRIVVSTGGSDPANATGTAVDAALAALPDAEVHVVAGPAFRGALTFADPRVHVHRSPPDMAALLGQADLVVGAAGTSAYERACLGIPSIVLAIADNQVAVAAELAAAGLAESLGSALHLSSARLSSAIRSLATDPVRRQAMRDAGMRLVDGSGVARVANHLDRIRLRAARWSDGPLLLEWANDPETRRQSLSTEPIGIDAHDAWLQRNLMDSGADLLIAENGLGPVGMLRLATGWHGRQEVSINIAPKHRGGLGTLMLQAAVTRWDRRLRGGELVARIKPGNVPSERAFTNVGFQRIGEAGETVVYSRPARVRPRDRQAPAEEDAP